MNQNYSSIHSYLDILQLEYVIFSIRLKLYTRKKDQLYCEKVLLHKKTKIEDISLKNNRDNIFTNKDLYQSIYNRVIVKEGFPKFDLMNYSSIELQQEFENKDWINYYQKGRDVRVQIDQDQFQVGKIICADKESSLCQVKLKGQSEITTHPISYITRIL